METPDEVSRLGIPAGSVFQINEHHGVRGGRDGWVGAFVMAEEIKAWGIQGYVPHVQSHGHQSRAYIRLEWNDIDYVGRAPLVLADAAE